MGRAIQDLPYVLVFISNLCEVILQMITIICQLISLI